MKARAVVVALLLAGMSTVGCTVFPTTTPYTGTVSEGAFSVIPITLSQAGAIAVTLTSITPASSIGIGVGQPAATTGGTGTTCTPTLASNASATVGATVTTNAAKGSYCVVVYDSGTVSGSATYAVEVSIT